MFEFLQIISFLIITFLNVIVLIFYIKNFVKYFKIYYKIYIKYLLQDFSCYFLKIIYFSALSLIICLFILFFAQNTISYCSDMDIIETDSSFSMDENDIDQNMSSDSDVDETGDLSPADEVLTIISSTFDQLYQNNGLVSNYPEPLRVFLSTFSLPHITINSYFEEGVGAYDYFSILGQFFETGRCLIFLPTFYFAQGVGMLCQLDIHNPIAVIEPLFQLIRTHESLASYEYLDNQRLYFYYLHLFNVLTSLNRILINLPFNIDNIDNTINSLYMCEDVLDVLNDLKIEENNICFVDLPIEDHFSFNLREKIVECKRLESGFNTMINHHQDEWSHYQRGAIVSLSQHQHDSHIHN